jgi:hypothetical protein
MTVTLVSALTVLKHIVQIVGNITNSLMPPIFGGQFRAPCYIALNYGVNEMFNKLKCFIGWHAWKWRYEGGPISLNDEPPRHAKCARCGINYGSVKK